MLFTCPYCRSNIELQPNNQFCPVCNSFLGNVENQNYLNSQNIPDYSKYEKQNKQNTQIYNANAMYSYDTEERFSSGHPYSTVNAYLIENNDYYMDAFKQIDNKQFVFNKNAFLFGILFFLYRKMYLEAIISIVVCVLISLLLNLTNTIIIPLIGIVLIQTAFGFSFNMLYFNHIKSFLDKNGYEKRRYVEIAPELLYKFNKYGGVNKYWIALAFIFIFLALLIPLSYFTIYTFYLF